MATAISLTSADQFSVLSLDCLVESATNPRRTFDEANQRGRGGKNWDLNGSRWRKWLECPAAAARRRIMR